MIITKNNKNTGIEHNNVILPFFRFGLAMELYTHLFCTCNRITFTVNHVIKYAASNPTAVLKLGCPGFLKNAAMTHDGNTI